LGEREGRREEGYRNKQITVDSRRDSTESLFTERRCFVVFAGSTIRWILGFDSSSFTRELRGICLALASAAHVSSYHCDLLPSTLLAICFPRDLGNHYSPSCFRQPVCSICARHSLCSRHLRASPVTYLVTYMLLLLHMLSLPTSSRHSTYVFPVSYASCRLCVVLAIYVFSSLLRHMYPLVAYMLLLLLLSSLVTSSLALVTLFVPVTCDCL